LWAAIAAKAIEDIAASINPRGASVAAMQSIVETTLTRAASGWHRGRK
jgi:hypothetical protein